MGGDRGRAKRLIGSRQLGVRETERSNRRPVPEAFRISLDYFSEVQDTFFSGENVPSQ